MAKQRKTRKRKIAADFRHQNLSPKTLEVLESVTDTPLPLSPISSPILTATPSRLGSHITTVDFQFVRHDLSKTALLTGAIIIVELVLFFVLK